MLNLFRSRAPCFLSILPFNLFESEFKDSETARSYYLEQNKDETGWDRLYHMYSVDEFGSTSPEMNFVIQGTSLGTFVGVVIGGVIRGRSTYINFIETNQATKFSSTFEAQRKLQDKMMTTFIKGAFQWGWRLGLFCGSYVLITTSIAAYRGRSSILEYTVAGFVTGMCYKFALGPVAMLVGGGVGGVFGSVAGLISLGVLRLSGTTMEEIRYWQYSWKKSRDACVQEVRKKQQGVELIEKMHDEMVLSNARQTQQQEENASSQQNDKQPTGTKSGT